MDTDLVLIDSGSCNACLSIAKRFGFDIGMKMVLSNDPKLTGEILAVRHYDSKVHLFLMDETGKNHFIPLIQLNRTE